MTTPPSGEGAPARTGTKAGTKGVPRAERERQVLAAATEEFGRQGYEATTMAAIAARVGVTKPLLHQYFGGKQDLYLACLEPIGERLLGSVRAAMAEPAHGTDPATGRGSGSTPAAGSAPPASLRVLSAIFEALDGQRRAWFVLYDPTLPPGSEAAHRATGYRRAIDALAAAGAADLLDTAAARPSDASPPGLRSEAPGSGSDTADASGTGAGDPDSLDADALAHAWRGLCTALVRWWIAHPDQSPRAMTERCARIFAAAGTFGLTGGPAA
ncbi:TetR/AcrR family transcriptional regulator [Streptomyces sp. NPDC097619]|uniref:TetR/AcrR family transcriptional regulator n=1 Tax=Streptomyces sp. NPDC097619 TaxID=3157228 RepID=UPI00332A6259